MSGASRWLDAVPSPGPSVNAAPSAAEMARAPSATAAMLLRIVVLLPLVVGWIAALFALRGEIGSERGDPVRAAMRTRGVLVSLPSVAPVRHDVGALGRHTHL